MRLRDHSALILAFAGLVIFQKVDWEWTVRPPPGDRPSQCNGIVLPPLPMRDNGWVSKRVQAHTEPASIIEGAETDLYLVTGYSVGDGRTPGQITADGRKVRPGITAACPKEFPLGTMVLIEGIGPRVCEDRGSAIVGKRLDVAFKTPEAALLFGKRWMRVAIIR